jgi:hypothetical protein
VLSAEFKSDTRPANAEKVEKMDGYLPVSLPLLFGFIHHRISSIPDDLIL